MKRLFDEMLKCHEADLPVTLHLVPARSQLVVCVDRNSKAMKALDLGVLLMLDDASLEAMLLRVVRTLRRIADPDGAGDIDNAEGSLYNAADPPNLSNSPKNVGESSAPR